MTVQGGCQTIEVSVNGAKHTVPAQLTILTLLQHLQIAPERVAVELNRQIIRQPNWAATEITPGATLEIVQFVGGG